MDEAALRRLLTGSPVALTLTKKVIQVESAAKRIATQEGLVDTGRYRSSIGWRLGRDAVGLYAECGSSVPYAIHLERGTQPHIILPRQKKALWWKGAAHPVRIVHHPGTRPYNVLRRALHAVVG